MSKPNPGLLELAHLIPYLQRDIEAGAGMRPNELCDALADALKIKGSSLLRKWFHWRQPSGQQIPRIQELRVLVNAARARGWLIGHISPEGTELLQFLEEDYSRRQALARVRCETELEPEIKKFAAKMVEILLRWDSAAQEKAREAARKKAREEAGEAPAPEPTASYEMGGRVEEKPAETYGLFDTIPLALKDISTALIDRIRDRWPDCEDRPRELSPENLRQLAEQVGEFAGDPFLRFADEILRDRSELVEYLRDCEQWSREADFADALADDRPAYRLWDNPKRCQPGDVVRTDKTDKKEKPE